MKREENPLSGWALLRRTAQEMREGKWLANAQSRSRASKTRWDALGFFLFLPIVLALWWIGVRLGIVLLHALRPTVTGAAIGFSGGPMKAAGLALLFSPFMASIASAFWLANTIVYSIPRARCAQIAKAGESSLMEAQAGLVALALLGLAIYAVLLVAAILLA